MCDNTNALPVIADIQPILLERNGKIIIAMMIYVLARWRMYGLSAENDNHNAVGIIVDRKPQ